MSIGITKHNSRAGNSASSWRTGNGRSANPPSACRLPSLRRCRGFHLLVAGGVWMLTIMSGGCYGEQPPPDVTPPSFLNNYPYVSEVNPRPSSLKPYTSHLRPVPYALHPTPCTLHPAPWLFKS